MFYEKRVQVRVVRIDLESCCDFLMLDGARCGGNRYGSGSLNYGYSSGSGGSCPDSATSLTFTSDTSVTGSGFEVYVTPGDLFLFFTTTEWHLPNFMQGWPNKIHGW